jgi:hypothetical protein
MHPPSEHLSMGACSVCALDFLGETIIPGFMSLSYLDLNPRVVSALTATDQRLYDELTIDGIALSQHV